jgi:hypothetical protein
MTTCIFAISQKCHILNAFIFEYIIYKKPIGSESALKIKIFTSITIITIVFVIYILSLLEIVPLLLSVPLLFIAIVAVVSFWTDRNRFKGFR